MVLALKTLPPLPWGGIMAVAALVVRLRSGCEERSRLMAAVELHELEKIYPNGNHAVQRLSLTIGDGELLALVGPSGCGKTTVLRMIAGLEEITAGEIRMGGRVVNALSPRQRNIAMVFQDYALYPQKTIRKNLEFPLRMMSQPRGERNRRVQEVAQRLDLTAVLEHKPRQLSGGQRQRVAMGRAMVREPEVFLLDEPLSNLDAQLRGRVRGEIAQLQRQLGTTMIYVTHDQVEAMTLGHRVAVMLDGKLQQVAPGQELYDRPANVFVGRFIGGPPMNVFQTRLKWDEGVPAVAFANTSVPLPQSLHQVARQYENQTVYLGLRPEAFTLADQPAAGSFAERANGWPTFHAKVIAVEALGHENILLVDSPQPLYQQAQGNVHLTVRVPAGTVAIAPGEQLQLAINPAAAHWFAPEGNRLEAS